MPKNLGNGMPDTAMVFAAGFGKRMQPLTLSIPKPLIKVNGKAMIDYALDALKESGVARAIVNTHYLASQIQEHVAGRKNLEVFISHEPVILETGGGIVNALPLLGDKPFYVINTDTFWVDNKIPALQRLASVWNPDKMDALFLLAKVSTAVGYHGKGDFDLLPDGMLSRRKNAGSYEFVYSGYMIINPYIFKGRKAEPFSYTGDMLLKEPKYNNADGSMPRLYGIEHDGTWLHVGTPEAIKLAEDAIKNHGK